MTEAFKNSKPFGMNFRKFCNHVFEFSLFKDARSIQISSVMIKILKKLPIYISELKVKTNRYEGNLR